MPVIYYPKVKLTIYLLITKEQLYIQILQACAVTDVRYIGRVYRTSSKFIPECKRKRIAIGL